MERYLIGKEILQRWSIRKIELFTLIKEGLQPYSPQKCSPWPCKYTMQRRLKTIEIQLRIVRDYLVHPASISKEDEDWLFFKGKSAPDILKDLKREKKIILDKLSKIKKSKPELNDDSWEYYYLNDPEGFYLNYPEEKPQEVIDKILELVFLESEVVSFLDPEKEKQEDKLQPNQKLLEYDKKVRNLFLKIIPEIELIYSEIKKISDKKNYADILMKEAVLNKFDQNKEKFKIIKRAYLNFDEIYRIYGSNKKRDFIGGLLQKIMEGEEINTMGIKRTYDTYKEVRRNYNKIDISI